MRRRLRSRLAAGAAAALVTGCAGGSAELPPAPCPDVRILAGLESNTVFRGGASRGNEADLAYIAALQNVAGGCAYGEEGLTLNMTVDVVVDPGPALEGRSVAVPWFIAVAGPDGTIIDKQTFTANVAIAEGGAQSGSREAVEQRYAGVGIDRGPAYRLFLGLEIDAEEALRRRALLP
jgi:hypothetical protein